MVFCQSKLLRHVLASLSERTAEYLAEKRHGEPPIVLDR